MKVLKGFFVALLLAIFSCVGVSAEQASSAPQKIVLESGEGITQAMQRVGCNIGWLYQLMYENQVPPVKLRQLPIGATYTMKFNCLQEPSENIVYQSKIIMWTDRDYDRAQQAEAEATSLKNELGETKQLLEERQLQANHPFEHSEYQAKIAELELLLQEAQSKNSTFWTIETGAAGWELWAMTGVLLLVVVFWVLAERKVDEHASANGMLHFELGRKEAELLTQKQATASAEANAEIWQRRALFAEKELQETWRGWFGTLLQLAFVSTQLNVIREAGKTTVICEPRIVVMVGGFPWEFHFHSIPLRQTNGNGSTSLLPPAIYACAECDALVKVYQDEDGDQNKESLSKHVKEAGHAASSTTASRLTAGIAMSGTPQPTAINEVH